MHSSHMLREVARPEIVRDNMGQLGDPSTRSSHQRTGAPFGCPSRRPELQVVGDGCRLILFLFFLGVLSGIGYGFERPDT
jgi:hypothetical protein